MAINIKGLQRREEKRTARALREEEKYNKYHERAEKTTDSKKRDRLFQRAATHYVRQKSHEQRAKQLLNRRTGKTNDAQWRRDNATRVRHWFYDRIFSVVTGFRPRNPLSYEGRSFEKTLNGETEAKTFINKGRICIGGTKPMRLFHDGKQEWLCKEAVTCVGTKKTMGALVTEAASRLQEKLCPEAAVRSFAYRDEKGEVCGSLQERLDIPADSFDLFKWQTNPEEPLPAGMASQILREHVTDWLLCNFDTKGENFLVDADGVLRGIDKEQALSYLDREETERMSYTYSPNPNKTLYNTVFELYAQGRLDLDFDAVRPYVDAAMRMSDKEYLDIFSEVVHEKCATPQARTEMNAKILGRRNGMAAEYDRFFHALRVEREKNRDQSQLFAGETAEAGGTSVQRTTEVTTTETYRRQMNLTAVVHPARDSALRAKEVTAPERTREEHALEKDEPLR